MLQLEAFSLNWQLSFFQMQCSVSGVLFVPCSFFIFRIEWSDTSKAENHQCASPKDPLDGQMNLQHGRGRLLEPRVTVETRKDHTTRKDDKRKLIIALLWFVFHKICPRTIKTRRHIKFIYSVAAASALSTACLNVSIVPWMSAIIVLNQPWYLGLTTATTSMRPV